MNSTTTSSTLSHGASLFLRVSLGVGFLSAVADRFGLWGPAGTPSVAWGNFHNFLIYTAKLNPWSPASFVPALGWLATLGEVIAGVALIIGMGTQIAALLSGLIALVFALAMTFVLGVHAPLSFGVFVYSAASFLLACSSPDKWTLDALLGKKESHV